MRRNMVLAMACAAIAMVSIDIAIVNVALPSIQAEFGVGHGMLQWVVVAYSLLLGGFLLLGGRLADRLGRRHVFIVGLAVFAGASFLAGVAQQAGMLIAARGMQGFGAALIAPTALSLLAVSFAEGRERNRALGVFGAVGGVSGSGTFENCIFASNSTTGRGGGNDHCIVKGMFLPAKRAVAHENRHVCVAQAA
jgi:MFS family permease